ncbi:hypothetical protein MTBBW1_1140015 [Desulfamplus magnetovallimortis]|uniref:Peptidase C14 caspase domain-containing protein n=1 Tax=Desulfamplus magnetovallimortis TaxID=1246637 RepID=A0A1W1H617_9BACT|nr:caspase family protein [Desulfamplus magnetovallimortis]SLM27825.1 hypothetical protein MTBBW1_1140015 [Desulfamplus magnetovallimortis]
MKYALLIGIDQYQNKYMNLNGCVNDINVISSILQLRHGFIADHILNHHATGENIIKAIKTLMQEPDATELLLYYSGHGSQVPDKTGKTDEKDGMDEILCPHDVFDDYITDDTLNLLFQLKKESVPLTVIFDCCHSGTAHRSIDQEQEPELERYIPPHNQYKCKNQKKYPKPAPKTQRTLPL